MTELRYDHARLRALLERRDRKRGELHALVGRQREARDQAAGVWTAARIAAGGLALPSTLAELGQLNAARVKDGRSLWVDPDDIRAAEEAERYAADLGPRIRVLESEAGALDRLVTACLAFTGRATNRSAAGLVGAAR